MIVMPAITCVMALGLWVLFESGHSYMGKRWITPLNKEEWFIVFWGLIYACLICCKVMPLKPPGILDWITFDLVVVFHGYTVCNGWSFWQRKDQPPPNSPGANTSNQSDISDSRAIDKVKKPKPNKTQTG